ncbi:AGE family epimerase/isomerase [Gracilibacillus sp. HCP3S3_G5_1]|uniref:AGE family epimerase/isomerase n=1 Tax=unclassified Gracilibacillus TaxID=2625209 RepID=UPI003F8AFC7A
MDIDKLINKYKNDLQVNFLSFWEKAIDYKYGGVFTCFTNDGATLVSDKKYIWSQGRFLWLCSHLRIMHKSGLIHLPKQWEEITEHTYRFLKEHALISNNHAVYAVERNGQHIQDQLDTSIFSDCFYVLGCNAYAHLKNDAHSFEQAIIVYQSIKERIEKNSFVSEPYPIPDGYRSHSIPMILLNVSQELYETASKLNHHSKAYLMKETLSFLEEIMKEFRDQDRIIEMKASTFGNETTLLERHLNPGHTLESIWFMIHTKNIQGLKNRKSTIKQLANIADKALSVGWDATYGGLFRYVDKDSGKPWGIGSGTAYEKLIMETWDTKLWWPHAEALYTTLLLYHETGEPRWRNWFIILENYIFKTFPNPNKEVGEWIQIRDRAGDPIDKVVALPVKDPFHIIRSYLLIINLLERKRNHALRSE